MLERNVNNAAIKTVVIDDFFDKNVHNHNIYFLNFKKLENSSIKPYGVSFLVSVIKQGYAPYLLRGIVDVLLLQKVD